MEDVSQHPMDRYLNVLPINITPVLLGTVKEIILIQTENALRQYHAAVIIIHQKRFVKAVTVLKNVTDPGYNHIKIMVVGLY